MQFFFKCFFFIVRNTLGWKIKLHSLLKWSTLYVLQNQLTWATVLKWVSNPSLFFTKKYVLWGRERENIESKHICTCISGCLHSNIRNYKMLYLLRKDLIKLFPNVQVFISEFCNLLLVQGSQFFEKDFFKFHLWFRWAKTKKCTYYSCNFPPQYFLHCYHKVIHQQMFSVRKDFYINQTPLLNFLAGA